MPTYLMFDKNIWKKPDLYAIHDYICFVISTHWISDVNKNLKVHEITETQSEHKKEKWN